MVKNGKHLLLWVSWFAVFPLGIWLIYKWAPYSYLEFNGHMAAFLALMLLVAAFPLIINKTVIFVLQGVSLAAFLQFGLLAELLLTQIAVIAMLATLRIPKTEYYRYPLNLLMFYAVSICSAVAYYLAGGTHQQIDVTEPRDLFTILVYMLTFFISNQLIISLIIYFKHRNKRILFGKDLLWEGLSSIVVFPIGIILYMLYQEVDLLAFLLVGIPLLSVALIMKVHYSSVKINESLQRASVIGHQLAERYSVSEVEDLFMAKVSKLFPGEHTYLFEINEDSRLQLLRYVNTQNRKENEDLTELMLALSYYTCKEDQAFLFKNQHEWRKHMACKKQGAEVESILAIPIKRNSQLKGVLIVAAYQARLYDKSQQMILEILCSHFSIAIENAQYFEETKMKSERCALTGVYNYGYFESLIETQFLAFKLGQLEHLSFIMCDLDFFKRVNDTYGHENGNDVIRQVASLLEVTVGERGTLARYGGEEFVVLLPNMTIEAAFALAEEIRQTVANTPFAVRQQERMVSIGVTASIGVSSANQEDADYVTVVRNADRAMYTGAKRAGRNRAAVYVN